MMKRLLTSIAAVTLWLAPVGAHAQGGIGLKGGLSYANVSNSGILPGNLKGHSGFAAGLAIGGGGTVGLGLEGLYAQRNLDSSNPADSRKLTYVDVPAYLRLLIPTPGISPFVYAGPQASFELKCKTGTGDCPETGRPKTSYAGVIGGGVRLGGPGGLSVEGRYVYGLTDLKLNTIKNSNSYKTRSFLLLLGLGM